MSGAEVITIGEEIDPEKRLRDEWAASLREHMKVQGFTAKQLAHQLEERGHKTSRQAVAAWMRGEYSPRPHTQGIVAAILKVPAHRLFPIDRVA